MPIYEYLCHDCSYKFELKQSIKEDPVAVCSKCGKSVSRIISSPAIMFKGTGWYITDYSDKMKPSAGDAKDSAAGAKNETTAPAANTAPAPTTPSTTSSSSGSTSSSGSSTSST